MKRSQGLLGLLCHRLPNSLSPLLLPLLRPLLLTAPLLWPHAASLLPFIGPRCGLLLLCRAVLLLLLLVAAC